MNQRFTSYDRSQIASLDYAVNRSYSSGQGRFTTVDPAQDGWNLYVYANNDPINYTDPSGLNASSCSAEYSYSQCGGDSAFWGNGSPTSGGGGGNGGSFGDGLAYWNETFGGLPSNVADALGLHFERISNSQAGYGFITHAEQSQQQARNFDIIYGYTEDGSLYTYFSIGVDSYITALDRIGDTLRDTARAVLDTTHPGLGRLQDYLYDSLGLPGLKPNTNSNAYTNTETAVTIGSLFIPGPGGKTKATGWVARKIFGSLESTVKAKVKSAIANGIVAPVGQQGIIKLASSESLTKVGYTHKIKILGKGGDLRIYGKQGANGHIIFDLIGGKH